MNLSTYVSALLLRSLNNTSTLQYVVDARRLGRLPELEATHRAAVGRHREPRLLAELQRLPELIRAVLAAGDEADVRRDLRRPYGRRDGMGRRRGVKQQHRQPRVRRASPAHGWARGPRVASEFGEANLSIHSTCTRSTRN